MHATIYKSYTYIYTNNTCKPSNSRCVGRESARYDVETKVSFTIIYGGRCSRSWSLTLVLSMLEVMFRLYCPLHHQFAV